MLVKKLYVYELCYKCIIFYLFRNIKKLLQVNSISGVIEKSRLLGLRQFLHVHKEILRQSSVATQPVVGENDMNTSMLYA